MPDANQEDKETADLSTKESEKDHMEHAAELFRSAPDPPAPPQQGHPLVTPPVVVSPSASVTPGIWRARTSRYLVYTSVGDLSNVNMWVETEPSLRLFDLAAVYYGKL